MALTGPSLSTETSVPHSGATELARFHPSSWHQPLDRDQFQMMTGSLRTWLTTILTLQWLLIFGSMTKLQIQPSKTGPR